MSEVTQIHPETNDIKTVKTTSLSPLNYVGLVVFSVFFFAAQNLSAAPVPLTAGQQKPQVDSQSRKGDKAKDYGDINDEDSHAINRSLIIVAQQNGDKAKDYGDLNDEDSHATPAPQLQVADGDDKAKDYGDLDDDDGHAAVRPSFSIAKKGADKAKDYGDINDEDSHSGTRAINILA